MSSKNPFRTPNLTPNPTGLSGSAVSGQSLIDPSPTEETPPVPPPKESIANAPASPPSASTSGSSSNYQPPAGPPPGFQSPSQTGSGSGSGQGSGARSPSRDDTLNEELPPAYTPAADTYSGEATLEVGPRRPFQPPPHQGPFYPPHHPPNQPYLSPHPSGGGWAPVQGPWSHSAPSLPPQHTGGSGWTAYPGAAHRAQTPQPTPPGNLPPPRHPQSPTRGRSNENNEIVMAPPPEPVSDFARDFYAAGAGDPSLYGTSESRSGTNRYAAPPGPPPGSSGNQYAPPSGPPPQSQGEGQGNIRDGEPTKTPTPGHPLLLNGKLLVYPAGYECHKCNNTGFKNFDPSHPCRKCWDKYAKPYAGAITYTPWSSDTSSSSSSRSNSNFQRPLPSFRPPHLSRSATSATSYSSHRRAVSGPPLSRSITSATAPPSAYAPPPQSGQPPPQIHVASPYRGPPAGATIVQPGDARIGGRLCFKCGGVGKVPFLLFDEVTCPSCGGVGRLF